MSATNGKSDVDSNGNPDIALNDNPDSINSEKAANSATEKEGSIIKNKPDEITSSRNPDGILPNKPNDIYSQKRTVFKRFSRHFCRYCEKHSYNPHSVILLSSIVVILFIFTILLGIGSKGRVSSKVSALGLKDIGELATQAGYFTSVQTIRKSRDVFGIEVPGTQSNYVYSYDGNIKAGIDFGDIDVSVDDKKHIITVVLPEVKILSIEILEDSFVLYNDGANLFTSLKLEEINESLADLKTTAKETAIKNGLLENAKANAELLTRTFLASLYDMSIYTVVFK